MSGARESCPTSPVRSNHQSRWWFVASAAVGALLGLLSTRIGSGELDASTASDLRGMLAGFSAVAVVALGLQLVFVGLFTDAGRVVVPRRFALVVVGSLAVGGLAALATVLVVQSDRSFEAVAAAAVGVAVATLAVSIPSRSVLLGEERWRDFAFVGLISVVGRLAVTLAVPGHHKVAAVLAGLVAGELLGAVSAMAFTRNSERSRWTVPSRSSHLVIGAAASLGLATIVASSSLSLRRFLGDDATVYNEGAAIARLVFVLMFTAAFVFFPALARFPIGSFALRRSFHSALALAIAAGLSAAGAVVVFPTTFLDLVGAASSGAEAGDAIAAIRLLTVAFVGYGIAGVSLMQYIAHGSRFALCTWPLSIVMIVAQVVSDSATTLAWWSLGTSTVLVVVASLPALLRVQPVLRPDVVEHPRPSSVAAGSIAVVIPSYNPGPIVVETVDNVVAAFATTGTALQVIVVSDGSTDGSTELLEQLGRPEVRHLVHPVNRGKGAALRTGFAAAEASLIGFVDSDGDIDPRALVEMVRIQNETGADVVFGSKRHAGSTVSVPLLRRVSSKVYTTLIRVLFQMDIVDTQTGVKLYSGELIGATLPLLEEEGFALDLELFVAARAAGFDNFVEVPVELVRKGGSTVLPRAVVNMILRTLRIFWRSEITLHYLKAGTTDVTAFSAPPSRRGSAAPATGPGRRPSHRAVTAGPRDR